MQHGFKARDLADEIGIAVVQIYNQIDNLDELLLLISLKKLLRLENEIAAKVQEYQPAAAEDILIIIAQSYHHFSRDNYNL